MGNKKLRVINTETDNLVSNLRGEIAEIVTTWVLMRHFMASAAGLQTDDVKKDFGNPDLSEWHGSPTVSRLRESLGESIGELCHISALFARQSRTGLKRYRAVDGIWGGHGQSDWVRVAAENPEGNMSELGRAQLLHGHQAVCPT
jgi:hypothetical protein